MRKAYQPTLDPPLRAAYQKDASMAQFGMARVIHELARAEAHIATLESELLTADTVEDSMSMPPHTQPCTASPDFSFIRPTRSATCGRVSDMQTWLVRSDGSNMWVCERHLYPILAQFWQAAIDTGAWFRVVPIVRQATDRTND